MSEPALSKPRRGRPPGDAPVSHAAILDAVYGLLKETSARELTMEAIAARAKVGKATLYKWWPNKSALILAMFHERLALGLGAARGPTMEASIRASARTLVKEFNGLFGKVMADLIAEGQSDPGVLHALYEQHVGPRRAQAMEEIEKAKAKGEFLAATDAGLLLDAIFGAIYYRHLLRSGPLTQEYGDSLVTQVLRGAKKQVPRTRDTR
ncbi:MAG: TetR/AcrR family transcriptional regulator [Burkholderiaceae bacterium]|jgi:AcrR family transcriptional regulator